MWLIVFEHEQKGPPLILGEVNSGKERKTEGC